MEKLEKNNKIYYDKKKAYNNKRLEFTKTEQRRMQRAKLNASMKNDLKMKDTEKRRIARQNIDKRIHENEQKQRKYEQEKQNHLLTIQDMNRMDNLNLFSIPSPELEQEILRKVVLILGTESLPDITCIVCDTRHESTNIRAYPITDILVKV